MNKRIRKKQLRRALKGLLALTKDFETVRELATRKAIREVVDAYGKSPKEYLAALRRYMEFTSVIALCNTPSEFLTKCGYYSHLHQPPHS